MKEIFALQWKLNEHTFKNIGTEFGKVMTDSDQKQHWIENYRKAFSAELAELIREVEQFGIGTKNGKIEIVDMLHFLVSLSHLANIEPQEISISFKEAHKAPLSSLITSMFLALDDLQNSLKWKWWAKGGGYKEENAKKAVLQLWKFIGEWCALYGLDFKTLKEIYLAKNRLNFMRQDQQYNEDTKTDEDNLALDI